MLNVYNSAQENILKNISKANSNKQIFKTIWDWLGQINRVPIQRIREVLIRVVQFRAVALIMPQINQDSSGYGSHDSTKSEDAVVYGAGAKSAGSIDAAPTTSAKGKKGQTSLTGKNPFAILKASAIASVSSATYPNNFQNLPKAFPPFLGPMQ